MALKRLYSMSVDIVTIIIRSSGERTEELCKNLILEQGIPNTSIHIIREAPFSKALKVGFELGIAEQRPWTFCVDADVLLRPGSILNMIRHAEKQPKNVCEIQGFVLCKFFGGPRQAGNHLYRTSLLGHLIKEIPSEGVNIRPETFALNVMQSKGYPWVSVQELVGLHDFEQSYEDIFRKCFVQSHKHLGLTELFIPFWRSKSFFDFDYQIALAGYGEGIKYSGDVRIDKRAKYYYDSMANFSLTPKTSIDIDNWKASKIDLIIVNWKEPYDFLKFFPTGMLVPRGNLVRSIYEKYKWLRNQNNPTRAIKLLTGLIFKNFSKRLLS